LPPLKDKQVSQSFFKDTENIGATALGHWKEPRDRELFIEERAQTPTNRALTSALETIADIAPNSIKQEQSKAQPPVKNILA